MQDSSTATDIDAAVQLLRGHSWMALAAAVAWILVRISKDDRAVKWFPVEIAPRWRAWGAAVIGLVYGILHKLAAGGSWGEAIAGGLAAGNAATLGHELLIESLRKGRDLGMKKEDAPPPPPPKPPLSIKPPAGVTITGLLLVLCGALGCVRNPVPPEAGMLVVNNAACKQKERAAIAEGGTCAEKRDRMTELAATDPDCIGLYADAGPVFLCRAKDGGSDER